MMEPMAIAAAGRRRLPWSRIHQHVMGCRVRIDLGCRWGLARLGVLLDDRLHLHQRVVGPVEEGEEVETAEQREAGAPLVEHRHREVVTGGEHLGLVLQDVVGRRDGLASPGIVLGQQAPAVDSLRLGGLQEAVPTDGGVRGQRRRLVDDGYRLPRGVLALQADAVDPPHRAQQGQPAEQARQCDEEAEAGAEVGGQQQVDAAAQHADGDQHDDDAAYERRPGDRQGEHLRHQRLRSYWTMAVIWASVSSWPNAGHAARALTLLAVLLAVLRTGLDERRPDRPRWGTAAQSTPFVRFGPRAPPPDCCGFPYDQPFVWQRAHE